MVIQICLNGEVWVRVVPVWVFCPTVGEGYTVLRFVKTTLICHFVGQQCVTLA